VLCPFFCGRQMVARVRTGGGGKKGRVRRVSPESRTLLSVSLARNIDEGWEKKKMTLLLMQVRRRGGKTRDNYGVSHFSLRKKPYRMKSGARD